MRQSINKAGAPPEVPPGAAKIPFTVDSALLSELGERLVGQPHIALAELVKNSYDADATKVKITVNPDEKLIEVSDNGHGMTEEEFRRFWMRIGTPHKQTLSTSRDFGRIMTGSKGVGRLSVQFLGKKVQVQTLAKKSKELGAMVNWELAVNAGDLTKATAWQWLREEPSLSPHGTTISITDLVHDWTDDDIESLAQEIWWLRPPFNPSNSNESTSLEIQFESRSTELAEAFEERMRRILQIYHAEIRGELKKDTKSSGKPNGILNVRIDFSDGSSYKEKHLIPNCALNAAKFRILVYHLQHRQKFGIKVDNARDYLERFGGVHVYDGGFRLPYYGLKDADWLGIEYDHSRRITESKLLPKKLQVARGMQYLPTIRRLIGEVQVDTTQERAVAEKLKQPSNQVLQVQITRDRLIQNQAYENLQEAVRWALDFYATREAVRRFEEVAQIIKAAPLPKKVRKVEQVIESYSDAIPQKVKKELIKNVRIAIQAADSEQESQKAQIGLLGPLATAGMAALAYEHEFARQFHELEKIGETLLSGKDQIAKETAQRIFDWIERVRSIRRLFGHLLDQENLETSHPFRVRNTLEQVKSQVSGIVRGVEIEIHDIPDDLRFPAARFMEWSAIFQNVFINAYNAMLDAKERHIRISTTTSRKDRSLRIEDTGFGIDLNKSDELFEPFVRRSKISTDRQGMGLGGSGLGLTIVRMIADSLGCKVRFVAPNTGFSTAFEISWKEK